MTDVINGSGKRGGKRISHASETSASNDELAVLFDAFQPNMRDDAQFVAKLERRLEAVEYVKQMQEAQLRRYKYSVLVAFVCGIVMGVGLIGVVLSLPEDCHKQSWIIPVGQMEYLQEHIRMILLALLSLGVGYSIISAVTAFNDLGVVAKKKE